MQDIRPCRIIGLTSAKGHKLNGTAARTPFKTSYRSDDERTSVLIEGQPSPLSLKRSNIEFLPHGILDGGVGVGRDTIRDTKFNVAAVDCMRGNTVKPKQQISGPGARCRGNLIAALQLLDSVRTYMGGNDVGLVIMCTDLNVSRAIDIIVARNGEDNFNLSNFAPSFQKTLISIQKRIKKELARGAYVMANYRPHRIHPDGLDRECLGGERYQAVVSGNFTIYPCLDKENWDAMEVRYVDTSSSASITVQHEIYLDYGPGEAELYVQNAAALDEIERLDPHVMAQVDPQAYWGAVLHVDTCLAAIRALGDVNLIEKWEGIRKGTIHSRTVWSKVVDTTGIRLPPAICSGDSAPNWPEILKSDVDHERVASGCANIGLLMMLDALEDVEVTSSRITIHVIDSHSAMDIAGLARAITWAKQRESDHVASGNTFGEDNRSAFMKQALEEEGFGNGMFVPKDPLECCQGCGKTDGLKLCSKCHGVAYCGTECARAGWKSHKKECRPSFAHVRRSVLYLATKYGVIIEPLESKRSARLYNGVPTETGLISEASGTGSIGILYNPDPGATSIIMITGGGDIHNPANTIKFRNMSELDPPIRFLVACGPLCDIDVARGCIDEAISMIGGDICKLRMKSVLFNPLEWAAKKGNIDIVDWLCTDDRTKSLLNEGCPVSWACYTGHVDIVKKLVSYGSDPTKTDQVSFSNCPPLLMAAENGKLDAMKYLVDELGQDINMIGASGRNIVQSITSSPNWKEMEGHRNAYDWANARMGQQ